MTCNFDFEVIFLDIAAIILNLVGLSLVVLTYILK